MDGHHQHRHRGGAHDGEPIKRKKLVTITNGVILLPLLLHLLPTWLRRKLIRPLLFIIRPNSNSIPRPPPLSSPPPSSPELTLVQSSSKYDVFISFRGGDVRDGFLSHLYAYLNDCKKLWIYKDDVDLERGERISGSLSLAIERSAVYLVIFSPNYADSRWCLDELEKILWCKELYGRRVIPVFYGVDPSQVENQELPSPAAGEIQGWRAALREMANISGFDSKVVRPETKLIEKIAKAVFQAIRRNSQMVKFSSYSASRRLVGLQRKMERLESLSLSCLNESSTTSRTIGLWGMAGIGKTALAKAYFDIFSCQFEASYFFSNFAEARPLHDTASCRGLQNDFFSKLLGDEDRETGGTLSYDLVLDRIGRTRSLVVMDDVGDDVGNIGPLSDLLNGRYSDLFGPGSVIILTSRNKQLLKTVAHHVYEVKDLDDGEATRLFCLHAFKGDIVPQVKYMEMAVKAVDYTGGNPLAITVLGSHLYGRNIEFWDRELQALQDNPNPVVENVLRRSYDGLTQAEKDVFLNLACFYPYWHSQEFDKVEDVLVEGIGRGDVITNLVDKSLLRIGVGVPSHIEMSSLLQDLGRNIVNEERRVGIKTHCSKLWKAKDVYHLFKENKGTESIECILWDSSDDKKYLQPDAHMQPDAFVKMENLWFLVIRHGNRNLVLPKDGLECLPNALRILEWDYFASKCLPSQFCPANLVILHLKNSNVEQLWEDELGHVDLGNLKVLNLSESWYLRELPNLSKAKRLEEIHLCNCVSLVELPTSILDLPKLETLDASCCTSLKLNNLESWYIDHQIQGQEQSSISGFQLGQHDSSSRNILPNLKNLLLSETPIQKVPTFLHAVELDCVGCTELTEFPVIPSLERLDLSGSLIKELAIDFDKLKELKWLSFDFNDRLIHISNDFCKLKSLHLIRLGNCIQLKEFPDILDTMEALAVLDLRECSSLSSLPDTIGNLTHLETLYLSYTAVRELPSSIGDLTRLSNLDLKCCKSLASLPDTIHKLTNLTRLDLFGCDRLSHLPQLPSSLIELDAHGCKEIKWNFGLFRKLKESFPTMDQEEQEEEEAVANHLTLPRLPVVDSIGNNHLMIHLWSVDLSYTTLSELPASIGNVTRLSRLLLKHCRSLASLPDTIHKLSNLQTLDLSLCGKLSHLPELPSSLKELDAHGCSSLQTSSIRVEKHDLSAVQWNFSKCLKLDRKVLSKLVDKFTQDSVRSSRFSRLILPAKCGDEGRIRGCSNSSRATPQLHGHQPSKKSSKALMIYYALLDPRPTVNIHNYDIECVLLNNEGGEIDVTSTCNWRRREPAGCHDEEDDHDHDHRPVRSDHDEPLLHELVIWHGHEFEWRERKIQHLANVDHVAVQLLLFRILHSHKQEIPNLIKNCGVVSIYDDNKATFDGGNNGGGGGGDADKSAERVQGLYDRLCA